MNEWFDAYGPMNHHIRNMRELAAMKTPPIKSIRWKSEDIYQKPRL